MRYAVEINECGIFASTHGADWWGRNVLSRPIAKRLEWLAMTPGGGLAHLPCEDKEEAGFVRDYMTGQGGIHPRHVKVKRIKAGQQVTR